MAINCNKPESGDQMIQTCFLVVSAVYASKNIASKSGTLENTPLFNYSRVCCFAGINDLCATSFIQKMHFFTLYVIDTFSI